MHCFVDSCGESFLTFLVVILTHFSDFAKRSVTSIRHTFDELHFFLLAVFFMLFLGS